MSLEINDRFLFLFLWMHRGNRLQSKTSTARCTFSSNHRITYNNKIVPCCSSFLFRTGIHRQCRTYVFAMRRLLLKKSACGATVAGATMASIFVLRAHFVNNYLSLLSLTWLEMQWSWVHWWLRSGQQTRSQTKIIKKKIQIFHY